MLESTKLRIEEYRALDQEGVQSLGKTPRNENCRHYGYHIQMKKNADSQYEQFTWVHVKAEAVSTHSTQV